MLSLELLLEVLEKSVVEILSSQMSISSGGLDGEDSTGDGEQRDIESSSSEIEDEDELLLLRFRGRVVESVSDRGGGRLVDDSENVESSDRSGILNRAQTQPHAFFIGSRKKLTLVDNRWESLK